MFAFDYDEQADTFKSSSKNKDLDLLYDVPVLMLNYYNSKPENVPHLAAVHPSLRIANIDLGNLELIHHRHSCSDFERLMSSPYLEHITIRGGRLGYHGLIPDVTAGLRKQAGVKALKNISLIGNQIGDLPDNEIQAFLDALFSLSHIDQMEINLSHNEFAENHYTMMYETCRFRSL